jgi:hypothetical protein
LKERHAQSISQAVTGCLQAAGRNGASIAEIYAFVELALGDVPRSSVRSEIYVRLSGAQRAYLPRYERIVVDGQSRYRLLLPPGE